MYYVLTWTHGWFGRMMDYESISLAHVSWLTGRGRTSFTFHSRGSIVQALGDTAGLVMDFRKYPPLNRGFCNFNSDFFPSGVRTVNTRLEARPCE